MPGDDGTQDSESVANATKPPRGRRRMMFTAAAVLVGALAGYAILATVEFLAGRQVSIALPLALVVIPAVFGVAAWDLTKPK